MKLYTAVIIRRNKDMETITQIELTKKSLITRVNNSMTSYRKYLVYFNAYVSEYKYMRLKKIITIFDDDIFEYYEKDHLTQKEITTAINDLIYCNIDYINNDVFETREICNKSIIEYNYNFNY